MILLGIPLILTFTGSTFLWNFLAVLWFVIPPCNTFIVLLSDSTLDMSVILSVSPFVFDTHWNFFFLAVLLIGMLPCSQFYCYNP